MPNRIHWRGADGKINPASCAASGLRATGPRPWAPGTLPSAEQGRALGRRRLHDLANPGVSESRYFLNS